VKTESLTAARAQLPTLLDTVERTHERVAITRQGRVAAVLINPDDLEALEDTLELLSDPIAMAEIAQAREQLRRGESVGAAELRQLLAVRRAATS